MRIQFKKPEDVESFLPMVDEATLRSSSWIRYIGSSPSQFSCSRGLGDPVLFLDAPTLFVPEKDDYTEAFSIFVKVIIRPLSVMIRF